MHLSQSSPLTVVTIAVDDIAIFHAHVGGGVPIPQDSSVVMEADAISSVPNQDLRERIGPAIDIPNVRAASLPVSCASVSELTLTRPNVID